MKKSIYITHQLFCALVWYQRNKKPFCLFATLKTISAQFQTAATMPGFLSAFSLHPRVNTKPPSAQAQKKKEPGFKVGIHFVSITALAAIFMVSFMLMKANAENHYHDHFDYSVPVTARIEWIGTVHLVAFFLISILTCRKLNSGIREVFHF